jgi:excinuclease ABC subunit C
VPLDARRGFADVMGHMSAPREKVDFRKKLGEVPHKPGVYLHRDRFGRVIYVGKARDLRKRLSNYFMASRNQRADLKTRALLDAIYDFDWHLVGSEPEAMLLEGRLIKEYRPRYNISFRDDKRFLLVKVDEREDWPRFRLTRFKAPDDGCRYFGPFAHAGALRQTLAFMRKKFGVLTFGRGSPNERELKSSTYQVPMKLADTTVEQYKGRVAVACEFLDGQSKELLGVLEDEMKAAAAKLDFERAAELRNMLDDLRKTTKPMVRYTTTMRHRLKLPGAIDPAADLAALGEALGLQGPPRRMECFDISNISTTHVVASMVCFIDGRSANHLYRRYRIRTVDGQDDFASMAEVVRRRYSRVLREVAVAATKIPDVERDDGMHVEYSPEISQERLRDAVRRVEDEDADPSLPRLPDLIIVDGGKGQLSSACRELQQLGLYDDVPIIGLAKEFEEIYRPGRPMPLILPHESGALKLLQRIRDEAHRWANGYHQLLMKRRISESVLDDCPGVSDARKQALIRKFGSVSRLRRAEVDEIAKVAGIGPKLAQTISTYLRRQ